MALSTGFRSTLVFLFDVTAVLVAWAGAFLIRFNFDWPIPVDRATIGERLGVNIAVPDDRATVGERSGANITIPVDCAIIDK